MKSLRSFRCIAVAAGLALGWCSLISMPAAAQQVKESTKLDISIQADAGVNPDDKARPNPIMVRVYELKNGDAFNAADYFSLANADKETLAADLLVKDEFILRPGETRQIQRKSNPDATVIGVLAGYQDLGHAIWRADFKLAPAPEASMWRFAIPANKAKLLIRLQAGGILLTPVE